MYFRYSPMVVAPIIWISPRANAGFKILAASMAPSAPPAPINVWISSINTKTFPSCCTSRNTLLIRSSNSPRYLEPATIADKSNITTFLSIIVSGTLPSAIFCASPSIMAVFPTPGSPTKQGLFLVLRLMI